MITYAQLPDLDSWVVTVPDGAARFLQYASILVAHACQLSLYDDQPGEPAASVLKDATCVQAASWISMGVDPANAGTDMPGPVSSSTILGATVARNTAAAAALAVEAVKGLCDAATDLLQVAGLLYVPVPLGAASDDPLPRWGQPWQFPYGYDAEWANSVDAFGWDTAPEWGGELL